MFAGGVEELVRDGVAARGPGQQQRAHHRRQLDARRGAIAAAIAGATETSQQLDLLVDALQIGGVDRMRLRLTRATSVTSVAVGQAATAGSRYAVRR